MSQAQALAVAHLATCHFARGWLVSERDLLKFYLSLVVRLTSQLIIREVMLRVVERTILGARP